MNSVKKFVKEHTLLLIFIIFCILLLILGIKLFSVLFGGDEGNKYANRLDGIEKYPIDNAVITKIESELGALENVSSVKYNLSGKIINVIFDVKEGLEKDKAKGYGEKVLEYFDKDELSFYDVQVYVKCSECKVESDDENSKLEYPIIGYKKNTNEALVWSNN